MRTIKFRGKSKRNGEWFYGNLYDKDEDGNTHICTTSNGCLNIDSETVGQFTGLIDNNGKEIYEGDIVKNEDSHGNTRINKVLFRNGCFIVDDDYVLFKLKNIEVFGNIYDNPELLQPSDRINSIKEFFDMGGVVYYYKYSDVFSNNPYMVMTNVDAAYSYKDYDDKKYNCSIFPKFYIKDQEYILFVDTKENKGYLEKKNVK